MVMPHVVTIVVTLQLISLLTWRSGKSSLRFPYVPIIFDMVSAV